VLGRSLKRIATECKGKALEVVDHGRAVKHRLLEICRAAQGLTPANPQRWQDSYGKLLGLTRGVVRQAQAVLEGWEKGRRKAVGDPLPVQTPSAQLRHFLPWVEKVIAQTRERIGKGNAHGVGKVLSLFEAHTPVIRKGKPDKPTELGRLVRIDEVEQRYRERL
jgi:transposase, IS5 family